MYAIEALSEQGVWRALKRTLNHNRLEIQPLEVFLSVHCHGAEARAGRINVKVILIGIAICTKFLYEYEEGLSEIFKVPRRIR